MGDLTPDQLQQLQRERIYSTRLNIDYSEDGFDQVVALSQVRTQALLRFRSGLIFVDLPTLYAGQSQWHSGIYMGRRESRQNKYVNSAQSNLFLTFQISSNDTNSLKNINVSTEDGSSIQGTFYA